MLEILTIAGVATVLSGVAQNVVGNIADRQICSFVTYLKARTRRNADSSTEATARVVRLTELTANLDGVVLPPGFDDAFHGRSDGKSWFERFRECFLAQFQSNAEFAARRASFGRRCRALAGRACLRSRTRG